MFFLSRVICVSMLVYHTPGILCHVNRGFVKWINRKHFLFCVLHFTQLPICQHKFFHFPSIQFDWIHWPNKYAIEWWTSGWLNWIFPVDKRLFYSQIGHFFVVSIADLWTECEWLNRHFYRKQNCCLSIRSWDKCLIINWLTVDFFVCINLLSFSRIWILKKPND